MQMSKIIVKEPIRHYDFFGYHVIKEYGIDVEAEGDKVKISKVAELYKHDVEITRSEALKVASAIMRACR